MQEIGILIDPKCRKLFGKINSRYLCDECHKSRKKWEVEDKKYQKRGIDSFSNLLVGFSSAKVTIPIDILVIGEAHGGGEPPNFRRQKDLDYEVTRIFDYYLNDNLATYHQQQMRKLFNQLDNLSKSWVFTDFIKCYVRRAEAENVNIATQFCKKYLDAQMKLLRPKRILILGKRVATKYFNLRGKLEHGQVYPRDENILLWSYFPSRMNADLWVEDGGWDNIIDKLQG